MKKFALLGIAALALVAATQQQAAAWCNMKFGAGINWSWQGGDNSVLWGLYRSGQVPNAGPGYGAPGFPGGGGGPGFPGGYGDQGGQFAPATGMLPANPMYNPMYQQMMNPMQQMNPMFQPMPNAQAPGLLPQQVNQQATWLNSTQGSGYQPVGYYVPSYNYQQPAPYYSYYGYPAYWYGY